MHGCNWVVSYPWIMISKNDPCIQEGKYVLHTLGEYIHCGARLMSLVYSISLNAMCRYVASYMG